MNIMLCGANDTAPVLPFFNEVSREMGFHAYNFIDGKIKYHNHGTDKWVTNAKMTLYNADALVFIITSRYGEILNSKKRCTMVKISLCYAMRRYTGFTGN